MNVILAGSDNAYFIENYEKVFVPYNRLFQSTKNILIPNVGHYEGYPNRDSLKYKDLYGLDNIKTLRRGTLRNKSYCSSWHVFVELGLTNNSLVINDINDMTHFEFFSKSEKIKSRSSFIKFLYKKFNINEDSQEIKNLYWIGMFSDEKVSLKSGTSAEILLHIISKKWTLNEGELDLIVMYHTFKYVENKTMKMLISYLKVKGESKVKTAMAKTVGLPIALLVEHIIENNLKFKGINLPFSKEIYLPILSKLKENGISFKEEIINI